MNAAPSPSAASASSDTPQEAGTAQPPEEIDKWDLQGSQNVETVGKEGVEGAWGIAKKIAGKGASKEEINRIKNQLLHLNPELAGTVKAGQRYYVPDAGTPESLGLARQADARWAKTVKERRQEAEVSTAGEPRTPEQDAAEIVAQNDRELKRLPARAYVTEAGAVSNERAPAVEAELQASAKRGRELAAKEKPLLDEIAQLHKDAEENETPVDRKREAELLAQLKPIQRASRIWNAERLNTLWEVYANQGGITSDEESEMRQRQAINVQPALGAIQIGPPGRGRTAKPNTGQPDIEDQSPVKMQVNSGDGGDNQKKHPNPKKAQRIVENEEKQKKKEDANREKHAETLPPDLKGVNLSELDVSTKLDVGENSYFGVNQRARVERGSGPTAITDWVKKKLEQLSPEQRRRGLPNGDKYDAHAEIHAIQQVIEAGTGKGQHARMAVNGEKVCKNCRTDIPVAAEKAGFASLTIIDKKARKTYFWKPGMTELQEVEQ